MRPDWRGLLALGVLPNLVYRYYMMHGLAPESFPSAVAAATRGANTWRNSVSVWRPRTSRTSSTRGISAIRSRSRCSMPATSALAEALAKAKPDVSLIISADHVNKFFIDNMPAFGIGMFDEFSGPGRVQDQAVRRPVPPGAERFRLRALSRRARPRRGRRLGGDGELGGRPRLHGPAVPARPGRAVPDGADLHQLRGAAAAEPETLLRGRPLARRRRSAAGTPTSGWRSSPPAACRIRSARCSRAGSTRTSITASSSDFCAGQRRGAGGDVRTTKSPPPDRRPARCAAGSCSPARSPAGTPSR